MKTTMSKRTKVLKIMNLAMLLNNTETKRDITGDKPTVFVYFNGHVNSLECNIHSNGWRPESISDIKYYIRLEENDYNNELDINSKLDECINKLEELCREWGAIK